MIADEDAFRVEPHKPHEAREPRPSPAAGVAAVVGIGASAGGVAAQQRLLAHAPAESGLAWVVVLHLPRDYVSRLAEVLQPHTRMPARQVTETVELEPDRVYVVPPGADLESVDSHLRLAPHPEERGSRASIDRFFRTLAHTWDGHSAGVVLSGTGSDGALGLAEIGKAGGLTVAQDPAEAEFAGMPQGAIAGGRVDLVLPLARIPEALVRFARTRPRVARTSD